MEKLLENSHQGVEVSIKLSDEVHVPGEMSRAFCDLMQIHEGADVADVGCGCGYLGIVASLLGAKSVISIDPSADALEVTRANCQRNKVANVEVRLGKELAPVLDKKFDVILANPPQTPFPVELPPMRYGGCRGTDVIERIIQQASAVLRPKGRLYLSHVSHAYPQRVHDCIAISDLQVDVVHAFRKPLHSDTLATLHPELLSYLVELWQKGIAELEEEDGVLYYHHRLYEIRH